MTITEAKTFVSEAFASNSIPVDEILTREYPQETVFVVHVQSAHLTAAAQLGNVLDSELQGRGFTGFVTVRAIPDADVQKNLRKTNGVGDERVPELIALISSRARTSESQPSLHYVPDAAANLARVMSRRHSLIFGRRGAGKTALMLEAKSQLVQQGHVVVWLNLQTYRRENTSRTAIWIASKIADAVFAATKEEIKYRYSHESAAKLRSNLEQLLEWRRSSRRGSIVSFLRCTPWSSASGKDRASASTSSSMTFTMCRDHLSLNSWISCIPS